jgi:Ni/Fe-hydrogenase subunit HybB-like protein
VRPSILTGLLGYTLGGMAVMFDLGRYWQVYNVFLPGYAHIHSVMFEVAVCVTAYVLVLWIEIKLFFFIGLGVLLALMHQSVRVHCFYRRLV